MPYHKYCLSAVIKLETFIIPPKNVSLTNGAMRCTLLTWSATELADLLHNLSFAVKSSKHLLFNLLDLQGAF